MTEERKLLLDSLPAVHNAISWAKFCGHEGATEQMTQLAERIAALLAAPAPEPVACCTWSQWEPVIGYPEPNIYETSCGHTFEFNEGGVADNEFEFCYSCGKRIEVAPLPKEVKQ